MLLVRCCILVIFWIIQKYINVDLLMFTSFLFPHVSCTIFCWKKTTKLANSPGSIKWMGSSWGQQESSTLCPHRAVRIGLLMEAISLISNIYIYQYMSYEICLCIFAMYCQQNLAFLLRIGRFFFGGETQEKYSYRVSFMDGTVLWSQSLGENSRDSQKARVEERAK